MDIIMNILNALNNAVPYLAFFLAVIMTFVAVWWHGRYYESKRPIYVAYTGNPPSTDLSYGGRDPYFEIEAYANEEELVTSTIETIQIGYLEPVTGPIMLPTLTVESATPVTETVLTMSPYLALPEPVEPDTTPSLVEAIMDELEELRRENAILTAKLEAATELAEHKEHLRAKWFRLLKIERQRVSYTFRNIMSRPRRPSKKAMLAEKIEVNDHRLKLVPRPVEMEWREQMAA